MYTFAMDTHFFQIFISMFELTKIFEISHIFKYLELNGEQRIQIYYAGHTRKSARGRVKLI